MGRGKAAAFQVMSIRAASPAEPGYLTGPGYPAGPVTRGGGSRSFTVSTTGEWVAALETMAAETENDTYTITVQGNVPVPGTTDYLSAGITVTFKGNGKLYLNSTGRLVRVPQHTSLIIDSPDLTLEGITNGQNGMTANNMPHWWKSALEPWN
jgi:hypothetical protein